ncbi:hypothetical protein [Bacillus suaedae]|nr:hypothetical protein [Bacillus suaedae]
MAKDRKQSFNQENKVDQTKEQRKQGYTGDKKLGGPDRPAE